jgi:hypothetical protein
MRAGSAVILALAVSLGHGAPPPDLPGEELTHDYFLDLPPDTATPAHPLPAGAIPPWLDKAQKTWDAPSMAEQSSAEGSFIPLGKGGVLIPRLTPGTNEPDAEIIDANGVTVVRENAGRVFALEPGKYKVRIGNGTTKQRMIRDFTIEEGKTVPLVPDWSGLVIETIDSTGTPFRGEYELVRIDEFEPFGRGLGANPDLGEVVKTWILEPGIYKILGVGQGYNSLINFVTVRLMPGELTKLLLVQNTNTFAILGGGTVDVNPEKKISSNWKYVANIGGSVKFNSDVDRINNDTTTNTLFGLLSTLSLTYQRHPYEWQTRVRLDEGFNVTGFELKNLLTDADDFLVTSLYIWRILSWLGPYGNAQLRTTLLPRRLLQNDAKSYFCVLDKDGYLRNAAGSFDSSNLFRVRPAFAPVLLSIGAGANADVLSFSWLEAKVRAGFGSTYSRFPKQYRSATTGDARWLTPADSLQYSGMLERSTVLVTQELTTSFDFGPQASLKGIVRIGQVVTADAELQVFAPLTPVKRFSRPDFDLLSNISWRLARWINLDYTYTFQLTQPDEIEKRIDKSIHGIWLRFSFTSR